MTLYQIGFRPLFTYTATISAPVIAIGSLMIHGNHIALKEDAEYATIRTTQHTRGSDSTAAQRPDAKGGWH